MELPLHPLVVHFPLGLLVVLPLLAAFVWIGTRLQIFNSKSWLIIVLLHTILLGSTYFAIETGEDQEHTVEKVIAEKYIEKHEDSAKLLLWFVIGSTALTSFAALDLRGRGKYIQLIAILGMLATIAMAVETGQSGGELVYKHHASQAYKKDIGLIQQAPSSQQTTKSEDLQDDGDDADEEVEDTDSGTTED